MTFSQRAVEAAKQAIYSSDLSMPTVIISEDAEVIARNVLTAAIAVEGVALQGWQPIESHDGNNTDDVLVSWNGYVAEAYYNAETDTWWQANTSEHDFDAASPIYPTHWMSLPQPPAASDGEERK